MHRRPHPVFETGKLARRRPGTQFRLQQLPNTLALPPWRPHGLGPADRGDGLGSRATLRMMNSPFGSLAAETVYAPFKRRSLCRGLEKLSHLASMVAGARRSRHCGPNAPPTQARARRSRRRTSDVANSRTVGPADIGPCGIGVRIRRGPRLPTRPITIDVPLAAGTGMDVIVRLYGDQLSQALGKPVIVENKPGAFQTLAVNAVLPAPADGYSLLAMTSAGAAINATTLKESELRHVARFRAAVALRQVAVHSGGQSGAADSIRWPICIKYAKENPASCPKLVRSWRRTAPRDGVSQAAV